MHDVLKSDMCLWPAAKKSEDVSHIANLMAQQNCRCQLKHPVAQPLA